MYFIVWGTRERKARSEKGNINFKGILNLSTLSEWNTCIHISRRNNEIYNNETLLIYIAVFQSKYTASKQGLFILWLFQHIYCPLWNVYMLKNKIIYMWWKMINKKKAYVLIYYDNLYLQLKVNHKARLFVCTEHAFFIE